MGAAYLAGLRRAAQRGRVVLVLFAITLAAGLGFTAAAWSWLAAALDDSLATRTLLANLDMNVFVDLFAHHRESLHMLGREAAVGALALAVVGIWLNGVAVAAVRDPGTLRDWLYRGLEFYPAYLQLWLLSLVADAAGIGAGVLLARGLIRWTAESTSELAYYWALAAGIALGAAVLLVATTVHDHARVRYAATGGALRAYLWSWRYVCAAEWRAVPLAMLLLATGALAWAVYQSVAHTIPTRSGLGIAASLLWGQALLLGRMLIRVWAFAAAASLQDADREGG